mgnify:CR=1 FL=1
MARQILRCTSCGVFSLHETCRECGGKAISIEPPKYSPDDKYAELKRTAKTDDYKQRGFL